MRKIAEDVYQLPLRPRNSVNAYLIGDVLIDAGIRSSWKTILRQLDSRKGKAHALTHALADHQGSSHEICRRFDVPLWCSPAEKWQAESGNATAEYAAQNHPVTWFQKKYWAGPGHPVSRELREGNRVAGFEVINTPGHSGDHLSFFRPEDRILIVEMCW